MLQIYNFFLNEKGFLREKYAFHKACGTNNQFKVDDAQHAPLQHAPFEECEFGEGR